MAMAFNVSLTAQVAGPAAPLAFAIGTGVMLMVGLSFVVWSRRLAHAGSAYGFITQAFGKRWGFLAGWALLLTYVMYGAGASALVGNFVAAAARTGGWQGPDLWLSVSVVSVSAATFLACRDMRLAGRTMLVLEGFSLLAVVFLALLILRRTSHLQGLSLRPFTPSPAHHGWAGVGYGLVFAVLSFGGFEAAATLGEETNNPQRNIPIALLGTLLLAGALYVLICYAQVIGFGLENTRALADDPAPLDTLAKSFVSRGYAVALDLAAALGGFSCVLGALSAAGRMLYALSRAGLAPFADRTHARRGTPANAILICGVLFVVGLSVWASRAGAGVYYGATGTIGTLAILLVYMGVALAQARTSVKGWQAVLGATGVLLCLWPLYNSVYPVPDYPGTLWPVVLLAWIACGVLLLRARPRLVAEPLPDIVEMQSDL